MIAALAGATATGSLGWAHEDTASTPLTDRQIDEAVRQLGDRDYALRERATRTLWAAGEAAVPALRRALEAGDPEVARRARVVLSNISYGVTPDMSDEVIALMTRYRTGDAALKRQTAILLATRGATGARVLLKLRGEERDAAVRGVISEILLRQSREMSVELIADGDERTADRVLAAAAETGDERAAMNYAAFLLVGGGLEDAVAATKARLVEAEAAARAANAADEHPEHEPAAAPPPRPADLAVLLTFLHRAAGDLPAARQTAEWSGNDLLLWNVLVEIGDWKDLARRAAADADGNAPVPNVTDLSFAMAFHRLAGDEAGVDRFAAMLRAAADRQPEQSWNAAEGLLINGRVDLGIEVLVKHGHLAEAVEFQTQRLAFDEIPRLIERARARDGEELGEVDVKAARAAWFTGDTKVAAAALEQAFDRCEKRRDVAGMTAAVGAAAEMGLDDRARWYTVAVLQEAQRVQPGGVVAAAAAVNPQARAQIEELFEQAQFRDAARAAAWWQVLRQRFPRDPAGKAYDTLKAIDARTMKPDELRALCVASRLDTMRRPPETRDAQLELVADTLTDAGRRDLAAPVYEELAEVAAQTSPARAASGLSKLAAFDAEAQRWREAADRYLRAWQLDRGNAVPLYLSGLMLASGGDESIGGQRMARAHLVPLADQNARHDLYEMLAGRKLTDDAARERDVILRTAEFLSWRRTEALRRAGDEAHAAGDATRAADFWERAFLDNNSEPTRFVHPWANVSMPALVRRSRAVGLIRAGEVDAGLREADGCLAMSPGDADAVIEVVTALDAAQCKPQADGLYARFAERYKKLSDAHPASGPLHNLYAWTAAKCRRELDAAVAHAARAVELQPTSTAFIDTLAEAHFQRGELPQAVAAMQRCVELEPGEPRHKEQLEKYQKALPQQGNSRAGASTRPSAR